MLKVFSLIFGTYFIGALIVEISKRLSQDSTTKTFCERRFLPQFKLSSIFRKITGWL
ncbi:hypothetical protein [Candidatus Magnetominusculus xianensis]|uniref:Secreted protein n=1 Tax=Candidatus Magnetominusculus xianensis TaxID=1748249 RepID=A0ABR5SB89_9BACT|nr:hypothetical protein [Candidatus Magnetominusculus xianensis]KWT75280.1 hypothetical protein ASN18_3248 [Candidatus Magnetominusculus xianensis]MBF0405608.1 hypothetical protein [Nitrospirota bacterium]